MPKSASLLDPDVMRDPYPFYRQLRHEAPVYWDDKMKAWLVTRYADVVALGFDPRISMIPPRDPAWGPRRELLGELNHNLVLFNDRPAHTRIRRLLEIALDPRVDRTRDRVQQVTNELLDGAQAKGRMEVLRDLAAPLPLTVLSEFMGVPTGDSQKLFQLLAPFANFIFVTGFSPTTAEGDQPAVDSVRAMTDYLMPLLEQRRREPRDDMLSAMIAAANQGDVLKPKELLWSAVLLLTGGYLAIPVAMGNCIFGLARYPDQFGRLRQEPALVDSAVEELLRFESQVQLSGRRALEDIELHGQRIRKEQTVILSLGSANRDETVFPDPDSPDVGRPENKHVAFGYNPHTCVARHLARLYMRTVIGTLAKRFKTLRLDTETVNWNGAPMFRSFEALPVAFTN